MSNKITVLFSIVGQLRPERGQSARSVLPEMLEDFCIVVEGASISSDGRILTARMTPEGMAHAQAVLDEKKCIVRKKLDPCK